MTLAACAAVFSLAYTLGPSAPRHAPRAQVSMAEYRLNNYILDGPMKPLGNQVRRRLLSIHLFLFAVVVQVHGLNSSLICLIFPSQVLVKPVSYTHLTLPTILLV